MIFKISFRNSPISSSILSFLGLGLLGLATFISLSQCLLSIAYAGDDEHFLYQTRYPDGEPFPIGTVRELCVNHYGIGESDDGIKKLAYVPELGLVWFSENSKALRVLTLNASRSNSIQEIDTFFNRYYKGVFGSIGAIDFDISGRTFFILNSGGNTIDKFSYNGFSFSPGDDKTDRILRAPDTARSRNILSFDPTHQLIIAQDKLSLVENHRSRNYLGSEEDRFKFDPKSLVVVLEKNKRIGWVTEPKNNAISRLELNTETNSPYITRIEFSDQGYPHRFVFDSTGTLWITDYISNTIRIYKVLSPTSVKRMAMIKLSDPDQNGVSRPNSGPYGIVYGPDENIWATLLNSNSIIRINPNGQITGEWRLKPGSKPTEIISGPNGKLYFIESGSMRIGAITAVVDQPLQGEHAPSSKWELDSMPMHQAYANQSEVTAPPKRKKYFRPTLPSDQVSKEDDCDGLETDCGFEGKDSADDETSQTVGALKSDSEKRAEIPTESENKTCQAPLKQERTSEYSIKKLAAFWRMTRFRHIEENHYFGRHHSKSQFNKEYSKNRELQKLLREVLNLKTQNDLVGSTTSDSLLVFHHFDFPIGQSLHKDQWLPTNNILVVLSSNLDTVITAFPIY